MTPARRAFAMLVVLWVIVLATLLLASIEGAGLRQASEGRESLARVRAYWAARGGLETTLARLEHLTEYPDTSDAYLVMDEMAAVAQGSLEGSEYLVAHSDGGRMVLGPADAHARVNIGTMSADALMLLTYMTEDVADAILDWMDADDDVRPLGAEIGQYQSLPYPYIPRNARLRTLAELELVLGVDPLIVRGEDWNLNGLLDSNEDDGNESWPPDNGDGKLDGGWSSLITVASRDGGLGASGQERLDLTVADTAEVAKRLGVDASQAEVIVNFVSLSANASLADFIRTDLNRLRDPATNQPLNTTVRPLTRDQLATLLNETRVGAATAEAPPGKVNINTCSPEVLETFPQIDAALADAIMGERASRTFGFTAISDLLDVPGMTRNRLAQLYPLLDVGSNVYVATVRGRDVRTGMEVEIVATLDRSTLPVTIREIRVR